MVGDVANSLIADFAAAPRPNKVCGIAKAREQMKPDEASALDGVFDKVRTVAKSPRLSQTSGYTYAWVLEILVKNGYEVTHRMVEKHARRMCSCNVN